jgi:DNA-binding LacI/PurR family transcriptional regulator
MHVSIKDVALRANVSRGTVSSVLTDRTGARISAETKERVRRAASELGYIPNQMARSIFKGKTHLLGMLTSGIGDPFFAELIGASEAAIAEAGYGRLVDASFPHVAKARPEILSVWPVDGILMHAAIGRISEGILGTRVSHVPVVYLDSPADAYRDTVQFDLGPGLKAAAKHMIERGHTRFGIVGPYDQFDLLTKQRNKPLYEACKGLDNPFLYFRVEDSSQRSAFMIGLQIAAMQAGERPTAIFCNSDYLAIGVFHGLIRGGVCIPQEVAVVGEGGIEAGEYISQPLSTIKCPVDELCRIAVSMLHERIESLVDCPPRHVTVPTFFIPRETT